MLPQSYYCLVHVWYFAMFRLPGKRNVIEPLVSQPSFLFPLRVVLLQITCHSAAGLTATCGIMKTLALPLALVTFTHETTNALTPQVLHGRQPCIGLERRRVAG